MSEPSFEIPIREFVKQLVAKNYQKVVDLSFNKILNAEWIEKEIKDYLGRITIPPDSAYQDIEVNPYNDGSGYWVNFPLWFNDESSDLELIIDVKKSDGKLYFSLEDIHVL